MEIPNPAKINLFLRNSEVRKKLFLSFIAGFVVVVGGFLLVKQISEMRPTENGVVSTEDGENGEPVVSTPPPPSPLEELGKSVEEYEADLEEIGKFDFELYPPDLQLQVSF